METIIKRITKVLNRILEVVVWVTSLILILMMLLIVYDVFMRYLLRAPSGWIDDFVSLYLMISVTMLPAAWILLNEDHVAVEVFVSMLRPSLRRRMNLVTRILCLIYSMVLTWQAWIFTWRELSHKTTFPTGTYMPAWPAPATIFVGGILLCIVSIMRIVDHIGVKKDDILSDKSSLEGKTLA